ncbi:MAG: HAMP domain-containing protein [Anaerolineaceae bacterium]|jgi:histidine kinase|nr:HAMP domain-containing protein [Anaerolineaceae bacterium]MEA5078727.1 ATP-binding protein [Anaerolineaceae bacterium]
MMKFLRTHLVWKVFLSYVLVVLVGAIILITAASLSVPAAFERHMASMNEIMNNANAMGNNQQMQSELFSQYTTAVYEAVTYAALAALIAAILASFFISRQVVTPMLHMMSLSQRIAEGEYQERLALPGGQQADQTDELGQLALRFNQMADKLEKTETMRRQLIGDVTHELRTPLTAVKGYLEGLMDGVLPADPETYEQIHSEIDRLQRLVNDLQELSRVEAGAIQLNLAPVPPERLIERIQSTFGRQFEDKNIQLVTDVETGLPNLFVDKDRIIQVLTNLAGNALQYTPNGGKVSISVRREKSEILFAVKDTGIGISTEQLTFIFNRFYRTDKSRNRASGGSGIGLTIAKALVQAHQGKIWAESNGEGKGSTFSFLIPLPK